MRVTVADKKSNHTVIILFISFRSFELRSLILECIELLLNNILTNSKSNNENYYDLKSNKYFIEFAWKEFCPSILFQFDDCGLPSKVVASNTIQFKQMYSVLIQLTGLIGSCTPMVSVFEAIYQRVLYLPEQDFHSILKLFKVVRKLLYLMILINSKK